jgi:mono/diheme cytochrome c family protein
MKRQLLIGIISALVLAPLAMADEPGEIFEAQCANCHGKDGKGKTKMGDKLKIKDLTSAAEQSKLTDRAIVDTITNGVKDKDSGKDRMKPFKEKLSSDEIKSMVVVVRGFNGK